MRLLRGIELLRVKNTEGDAFRKAVDGLIEKSRLDCTKEDSHRRDLVSHYILRLAYCRSEERRRWFLQQECALFKYRVDSMTPDQFSLFLVDSKLQFDRVDPEERRSLNESLLEVERQPGKESVESSPSDYYR